jgi:WXG100 family type VII secretion target
LKVSKENYIMSADIVQAKYDELEMIATCFGQWADSNAEMSNRLRQCAEKLINGDWIGKGVEAFSAEMKGEVCPAMQRLTDALAEARSVTLEVKEIIEWAEEEAASPFRGEHSSGPLYASLGPLPTVFAWPWGVGGASPPPYVIQQQDIEQYEKMGQQGNKIGSGECPAIAQNYFNSRAASKAGRPYIGKTSEWRAGDSLMDHPNLEYGTVIATFGDNGRYPNRDHGNHVAIFLHYIDSKGNKVAYNDNKVAGIRVVDQWNGHNSGPDRLASQRNLMFRQEEEEQRKKRRKRNNFLVNQANDMYVVTNPTRRPPE